MDTPLVLAQQTMTRHGIRHMPIQEDGKPVGMISNRDILAHQLVTAQNTVREQAEVFANLEAAHPGINRLKHDNSGRIVI
jgi:signal-transduction protein with cAMP-binding, CBS, and nucleotidyltransferase domain